MIDSPAIFRIISVGQYLAYGVFAMSPPIQSIRKPGRPKGPETTTLRIRLEKAELEHLEKLRKKAGLPNTAAMVRAALGEWAKRVEKRSGPTSKVS